MSFEEHVSTLGYQINVGLRLLNFEPFSQAYVLIRYPTFIKKWKNMMKLVESLMQNQVEKDL